MDFHETLGVEKSATDEEIKTAWRLKCRKCHPDLNEDGDDAEFIKVTHAYKMLTDAEYRNSQKQIPEKKNLDFQIQAAISFEDAFFGTVLVVNYNRISMDASHEPIIQTDLEPISIKVEVPPGTMNYQKIVPGMGVEQLGQYGDAKVLVRAKGHPRFTINGSDVKSEEQVPLSMLIKGGVLQVKTMYGVKPIKIKPGTPPGEILCARNCGVQKIGDHYVYITPEFPSVDELKNDWDMEIDWGDVDDGEDEIDKFVIDFNKMR